MNDTFQYTYNKIDAKLKNVQDIWINNLQNIVNLNNDMNDNTDSAIENVN